MTDFDPTTNRTPFGLLTPEERQALQAWPHGWQIFDLDGEWADSKWSDRAHPAWSLDMTYRGKPAAVVKQMFLNVYTDYVGNSHCNILLALNAALPDSIGIICVEIVDGELKAARVVEGDEE